MFRQTILIFFIFLTLESFAQTTIFMENHNGVYIVPCSINGVNLKFIFDTGASDVSISSTEALFMLKNGYLKPEDILGKQKYSNADGEISVGTKIILRQIEFVGYKLYNVEASIANNLDAPLLLGQTAISKLGKIQIEGNKLTILNGSSKAIDNKNSTNNNYLQNNEANFEYLTYQNKSRLYKIDYPSFLTMGRPPSNNDGREFITNGGEITLLVYSGILHESTLVGSFKKEFQDDTQTITYSKQKNNWYVISGYDKSEKKEFYKKVYFSNEADELRTMLLYYPINKRDIMEKIIPILISSFTDI